MYNVVTISSVYAHPIEYVLGNAFPTFAGTIILKNRTHFITCVGWVLLRLIETHDGHSGFALPFEMFSFFPIHTGSNYHNFHHLHNAGNFGSFTRIWDGLFGTNKVYFERLRENQGKLCVQKGGVKEKQG
jgi:sterol desaturase/sphingolipid hydroxylase (fatty acid hydroxylase superfamily)